MSFSEVWLPNLVCTTIGISSSIGIARWIVSRGDQQQANVLQGIIRILAEKYRVDLSRDKDGRATGFQDIHLAGSVGATAAATASLTTGASIVSGAGVTTPRTG